MTDDAHRVSTCSHQKIRGINQRFWLCIKGSIDICIKMELLEAASAILADLFLQSIDSVIIFATDHQNYSSPPEFVVVE